MWSDIQVVIETAYYVSGVFLLIGIGIGLYQLKILKKDLSDRNQRAAAEKSLEYLDFFSTSIMPAMEKYDNAMEVEVTKRESVSSLNDGKFLLVPGDLNKELTAETIISHRLGIIRILNQLEFFGVAMLHGVADESIVFTPVGKVFCRFVEDEYVPLSLLRSEGVPYKNLVELYSVWSSRIEYEALQLQKEEAENKMKKQGEAHKVRRPIGS